MELKRHLRPLMACLSMSLGSLGIGASLGYSSPAIPDINSGRDSRFRLDTVAASWVTSETSVGLLVGGLSGGHLLDRYGRKSCVMYGALVSIVGWTMVAAASSNVAWMHVGRILTGLSGGLTNAAVPVFASEVSEPSVRGLMGSIHQLFFNVGLLYVYAFALTLHWNWLAIACAGLPAVMVVLLFLVVPESPRWLLAHDYHDEAVDVLRWLRHDSDVAQEVAIIQENVQQNASENIGLAEFSAPAFYKPLSIVVALFFLQQISGFAAITEYLVTIFNSVGSSWDSNVQATIVGLVGVLANGISAAVVDRVGRRLLLFLSSVIMTLSLCGVGVFFVFRHAVGDGGLVFLPTISIIIFVFGFALGYGPIPFYLASELFPLKTRGLGAAIGVAAVSLSTFLTALCFPYVRAGVGDQGVYFVMAAISILASVFVLFVPETKGKSLEDIERMFA